MKKERFVQAKVDVAFKYIFGEEKSIDNLKYFLSVVLKIPEDELVDIILSPTEQHRDSTSDKESIFDVSATLKNGKKIEIERIYKYIIIKSLIVCSFKKHCII